MPNYDSKNAACVIFTFKEGLLSPVAHDLRLIVTRFSVAVDAAFSEVTATFDTGSLLVDTAMKDGVENPSALSPADKHKIVGQIRDEVLHVARFPQATFRSRSLRARADGGYDFAGELELHGVARPLQGTARLESGCHVVELGLHQPDFGIAPYKAMLGTLKIQSDVKVRLSLGRDGDPLSA